MAVLRCVEKGVFVMKTVKFFAAHVMPNLLFLSEILLGIVAAILSAGIEYSVFNGLLSNVGSGIPVSPVSMSALCVLCLEGSKVFLHMYVEIGKTRCQDLKLPFRRAQRVLFVLVATSVVCTFVWSTHVLYSDVVDMDSSVYDTDTQSIEQKYDDMIRDLQASAETTAAQRIASYEKRYQEAYEQYKAYKISYSSERLYARTTAEKERLKAEADAAFADYAKAQESIPAAVQAEISAQISEWEEQREAELQARKDVITTNTGANSYLHVVLMAVCHYLFGLHTYSPTLYFMAVMGFSVVLAGLLERLIGISLSLVALPAGAWDTLLQTDALPESGHRALRMITTAFLVSTVSTILFMAYCMFRDFGVEIELAGVALGVFMLVNVLMMVFYPDRADTKPVRSSGPLVQWPKVKSEVTVMVVKGCLSFVAFVFLGALLGNNFQELTLPAVGMTIGSAGGHWIHLPQSQEM